MGSGKVEEGENIENALEDTRAKAARLDGAEMSGDKQIWNCQNLCNTDQYPDVFLGAQQTSKVDSFATTTWKVPNTESFLVRLFLHSDQ